MIDSHCHLADEIFEADLEAVIGRARDAGLTGAMCILAAGDTGGVHARRARAQPLGSRQLRRWRAPPPGARVRGAAGPGRPAAARRPGGAAGDVRGRRDRPGLPLRLLAPGRAARGVRRATRHRTLAGRCPSSSTRAKRTTTPSRCWRARAAALPACSIASRAASTRARRALDLGFYLSLAGIVTFPKATDLREVAAYCPDDRLLVETDSPFLAPVPHRGKRNEPAFVARVVEELAGIRGWTADHRGRADHGEFRRVVRPETIVSALTLVAQIC